MTKNKELGVDPKDRGSWKVIYLEKVQGGNRITIPDGLDQNMIYKEKFIKFSKIFTYPNGEDERIGQH